MKFPRSVAAGCRNQKTKQITLFCLFVYSSRLRSHILKVEGIFFNVNEYFDNSHKAHRPKLRPLHFSSSITTQNVNPQVVKGEIPYLTSFSSSDLICIKKMLSDLLNIFCLKLKN